jgi:hypothetical protein
MFSNWKNVTSVVKAALCFFLAGAFMGGYCIFSPIFAQLSTTYAPFKLMAIGLIAWVLSAIMGATALTYRKLCHTKCCAGGMVAGPRLGKYSANALLCFTIKLSQICIRVRLDADQTWLKIKFAKVAKRVQLCLVPN